MLSKVANEFRIDKEVVLAAVKLDGFCLEFAVEYAADKDVVIVAVKQNGLALQLAADTIRGDKEVVIAAVKQQSSDDIFEKHFKAADSFKFAADELRADK